MKRSFGVLFLAIALVVMPACSAGGVAPTPPVTSPGGSIAGFAATPTAAAASASAATPMETQTPPASAAPESVAAVIPAALDIAVGRSVQLAVAESISGAGWSSSNPDIVSVGSDGKLSPLKPGESIVTLTVGASSRTCRVTVSQKGQTLAYPADPGPADPDGNRKPADGSDDNFPFLIPDDQRTIDMSGLDKGEYSWEFIIDDGYDTMLTVPNANLTYQVNYHIALDAHKVGGSTLTGDYAGTMKMEMKIDEASFLKAMKSLGVDATKYSSAIQVKTIDIKFKVVPYQIDEINRAKCQYAPGKILPAPLTAMPGMAVSSTETSTSGSMGLTAEDGYGSAAMADKSGAIPYVIEVGPYGNATLTMPRMLPMCSRATFNGKLVRLGILSLK